MKLLVVAMGAAALGLPATTPATVEKPEVHFECTASICVLSRPGFAALLRDYQLALEQVKALKGQAAAAEGRCAPQRGV